MEYGQGRGRTPVLRRQGALPVASSLVCRPRAADCHAAQEADSRALSTVSKTVPRIFRHARSQGGLLCLCLLLTVLLGACVSGQKAAGPKTADRSAASRPGAHTSPLPRADPGYLQWLERQSMLGSTQDLTTQVSGTGLIWRNSAAARRVPLLLSAAPSWLDVNPHTVTSGQPFWRALGLSPLPDMLGQTGLNGLFAAPTGERGDIWGSYKMLTPGGGNVTALRFDTALGSQEDFDRASGRLENLGLQLGGELPPSATGLGPDFILQARHASRFDGLYAMMAVPQKDWDVLPVTADEWDCLPLRPQAVQTLAQRGILPENLVRDGLPWTTPGGWAVTGEIRGADGQARRWVYRYSGHPLRPVLLWQDPSGQARRVFSAAVIRHTGLQQQTLAGLRMEALMGLDVPPPGEAASEARRPAAPARQALSGRNVRAQGKTQAGTGASTPDAQQIMELTPGLEALDALSGEIHRYGGWAMQDDALPPSLTRAVLDTAVDFTRDTITEPATAYALLTGDAAPLAALLRDSLTQGVDHSRLARGQKDRQSVDWRPLLALPEGRDMARRAQEQARAAADAEELWTTQAGLAALALGLDATAAARPEQAKALRQTVLLLLSFRVGLPGLAFISPQDMTGALNLARPPAGLPASMGSVPLWDEQTRGGSLPPLPLAFGALDRQWADRQSFLHELAALLRARLQAGLAGGRVTEIFSGPPGCVGVLSALPGGGYWLLAANFSGKRQRLACALPAAARSAREAPSGQNLPMQGRTVELDLDARQSRHIVLTGQTATPEGANP